MTEHTPRLPHGRSSRRGRWQTATEVLSLVGRQPGITRAAVARELGLSTSSATEVTAKLRELQLLTEAPAPSQGRGRPTTVLLPHPCGPLVFAVNLRQGTWRSAVVSLDGSLHDQVTTAHRRGPKEVLESIQAAVESAQAQYGERLRVVSLAVAGTVRENLVMQASTLGWGEVDLSPVVGNTGLTLLTGNDATLGGVAESRTGAAAGARTALHLIVEVGLGGTLILDGNPASGATGAGGEYGHMPFGDRSLQCPCGASGCWDLEIDGRALARRLGDDEPEDPYIYAEAVFRRTDSSAKAAVALSATALGSGIAGLVNAHDPDVITLGGLAIPIRAGAPDAFGTAYRDGLMHFHRTTPPPVLDSTHEPDGPLRGAAALGLDHLTSEPALTAWAES